MSHAHTARAEVLPPWRPAWLQRQPLHGRYTSSLYVTAVTDSRWRVSDGGKGPLVMWARCLLWLLACCAGSSSSGQCAASMYLDNMIKNRIFTVHFDPQERRIAASTASGWAHVRLVGSAGRDASWILGRTSHSRGSFHSDETKGSHTAQRRICCLSPLPMGP